MRNEPNRSNEKTSKNKNRHAAKWDRLNHRKPESSFDPVDMQDRQRRYYNDEYTGKKFFDDNYEPRNARKSERSFSTRQQDQQKTGNASSGYGGHFFGPQPNYDRDGGFQSYRGGYGNSANQGGYPISQGTGFQSGDFNHGGGIYGEYLSTNSRGEESIREGRRGPKGYQRGDERLTDDVCERLSHGHIDAENIEVHVSQGVVTLEGSVNSRQEKRMAEDLIENIFGVKDVLNHIRVGHPSSESVLKRNDAQQDDAQAENHKASDKLKEL